MSILPACLVPMEVRISFDSDLILRASDPLELQLQMVVNHHVSVRIKPGSPEEATSVLNLSVVETTYRPEPCRAPKCESPSFLSCSFLFPVLFCWFRCALTNVASNTCSHYYSHLLTITARLSSVLLGTVMVTVSVKFP